MKSKIPGLIALVIAAFIGGSILPSLIKVGLQTMHPNDLNFVRSVFNLIILCPFLLINRHIFKSKQIFFVIFAMSFVGINMIFSTFGLQKTTIMAHQLIYTITPATVAIISFFILKEKISLTKLLGILLAMAGVGILTYASYSDNLASSLGTFIGNLLVLIAMGFYSVYLLLSKKFSANYSPILLSSITALSLTLLFLPLSAINIWKNQGLVGLDQTRVIALFFLALASAMFAFCVQYGIKKLSATTTAFTSLLSPLFAVFSGIILFGEKMSFILIISLVLVLVGMLTSTQNRHPAK